MEDISALRWIRSRLARALGGMAHNGLRDYNAEFGYPERVTPEMLMRMYLRNGIASRIIRAYSGATWEELPTIRDEAGDSSEEKTADNKKNPSFSPFVKAVEDFFEDHQVLHYLERADRMAAVGHYGVLLMGFKDGQDLSKPLRSGKSELIFLQAYAEPNIKINRLVTDRADRRYGKPEYYTLQTGTQLGSQSVGISQVSVHHSRVLHISEFLDENDIIGTPRLVPVYNHLLDLEKVIGSSAETFWHNARPTTAYEAEADADITPAQVENMKEQAFELEHQLRRSIALQGIKARLMSSNPVDPAPNVDKLLDLIAGGTGIPRRVLVGSERGELGGDNDQDNWASRIDERQHGFAGPMILVPFTQKMIDTGNLPAPEGSFWAEWPESNALSPMQQSELNLKRTQSLAAYSSSASAEMIVPPQEFRRDFLDLPPESEYELPEEEELDEDDPNVQDEFEEGQQDVPPEEDEVDDEGNVVELNRDYAFTVRGRGGRGGPVIELPGTTSSAELRDRVRRPLRSNRAPVVNAKPRTLYVYRRLLNAEEVRSHFKGQGLDAMVPAAEMHVTIAYSRTKLDWMKIGEDWTGDSQGEVTINGGPRLLELFGKTEKNTLVLLFSSSSLSWRHEDIKRAGATWDWPSYEPHVSITYDFGERDLDAIEPYSGQLVFGPEVFQEIIENWGDGIKENVRG